MKILALSVLIWIPAECSVEGWGGLVKEKCWIAEHTNPCIGRGPAGPWWCYLLRPEKPK